MEEKRQSIRIEKSLMVRYSPEIGSKDNWSVSFVKNISETGVLFDTNNQYPVGENLLLMLKIPLDPYNWMETKGSVVESAPYVGKSFLTRLKFVGLNDAQRSLIREYVAWFLSGKSPNSATETQNEKRKAERIYKSLVVSYGVENHLGVVEKWDITSVRNLSKTGMVFTSSYRCEDVIDFMIKVPSHPYEQLRIRGRVIESSALKLPNSEIATGTFLTRVEFVDLKEEYQKVLSDYVAWLIKNDPDRPKKEEA
jgi:Tfp pilus assembly protein PilZ